jgi:MerR family transcriptional regulator/heat shock protein HspR
MEPDAVYTMAVAARLSGMHPQTLRKYERAGLLRPARQAGNQRLYSAADIRRLHRIRFLVDVRGINVAGIALVLSMSDRLEAAGFGATRGDLRRAVDEAIDMSQGQSQSQAS